MTERHAETVIVASVWLAVLWAFVSLAECPEARGEAAAGPPVAVAVSRLQPGLSAEGARRWGDVIDSAAETHGLDPILVAALVMRESSFDPRVADGRRRGSRGEVGALQVIPGGFALRFAPDDCRDQTEARCSVATGCAYLAHLRDEACPGSTWRWAAAYRWRRCPSEAEARRDGGARRLKRLYDRAGGRGWR